MVIFSRGAPRALPHAEAGIAIRCEWFRAANLAPQDEEGYSYIVGRLKGMFITGGVNLYRAQAERELVLHPEIESEITGRSAEDTEMKMEVALWSSP